MANLITKTYIKIHQNRPRFVKDMTKTQICSGQHVPKFYYNQSGFVECILVCFFSVHSVHIYSNFFKSGTLSDVEWLATSDTWVLPWWGEGIVYWLWSSVKEILDVSNVINEQLYWWISELMKLQYICERYCLTTVVMWCEKYECKHRWHSTQPSIVWWFYLISNHPILVTYCMFLL